MFLKWCLREHFLQREKRPHDIQQLFEVEQEEWNLIHQGTIDEWIDDLCRRLQAILNGDGGHT